MGKSTQKGPSGFFLVRAKGGRGLGPNRTGLLRSDDWIFVRRRLEPESVDPVWARFALFVRFL